MSIYPLTKIINIGDKSYIYDANIDKIALMPYFIENIDFIFDDEYIERNKDILGELINDQFWNDINLEKISSPLTITSEYMINNKISSLNLQVTNDCTMKCKY